MHLALNPEYKITKHRSTIILHNTILVGDMGTVQSIAPVQAIILALYNGTRTLTDVLQTMGNLGFEKTHIDNVRRITQDFSDRSILIDMKTIKDVSKVAAYDPLEFAFDAEVKPIGSRLECPIGLTYIVTRGCRRFCRYCFANTTYPKKEELISFDKIRQIIDEAYVLGIRSLNISGGEPFLRPDIIEVLEYMLDKGMYVTVSTKESLSEDIVRRLKNAGLNDMQVSLDSSKPETANLLVGVENYFDEIITTIRLLIEYGIKVHINCVITAYNIKHIPDLLDFLDMLGTSEVALSPYTRSLGRHSDDLFPSADDQLWLNSIISQLREKHKKLKIIPDDPPSILNEFSNDEKMPQRTGCSVGVVGFIILPNGEVTVCERVPYDPDLIMGNLNYQSIMEIWSSSKWDHLCFPSQEQYIGTECYACEDFEYCTKKRSRCLVNSLIVYGKIHAPEPTCPRIKMPDIRLT